VTVTGILVVCKPEAVSDVASDIRHFEWAHVHYTDPNGRFVITVEASSTEEGIERQLIIQKLPRVILAEMVEHYVGEEPVPPADPAGWVARGLDLNEDAIKATRLGTQSDDIGSSGTSLEEENPWTTDAENS
jgi:nitrate reductase NapAB chaperone NapD